MTKSLAQQAREVRARLRTQTTPALEGMEDSLVGSTHPDARRLLKLIRQELVRRSAEKLGMTGALGELDDLLDDLS